MKPSIRLAATLLGAAPTLAQNDPTLQLSTDGPFNFQFLISMGISITGGANIGPFQRHGFETKAQAEDSANAYDPVNVRDTWLSASAYFRQADTYLHGNWSNPLIDSLWVEQTAAFDNAIASLPIPGQRIQLFSAGGNSTIEAIWYAGSTQPNCQLPKLVVANGYDAAQEGSYHYFCAPALARGWNCITFEGPGQPTVRRNQNIGFIPEWEIDH